MIEDLSPTENKLLDLLVDSDILIDQLYHLQNFPSIVNYNPNPDLIILNKDSQSFINFKNDYHLDIWPRSNKRLTRRILIDSNNSTNQLKLKLSSIINDRIIGKLDTSDSLLLNLNKNKNKRKLRSKSFTEIPVITKKSKRSSNYNKEEKYDINNKSFTKPINSNSNLNLNLNLKLKLKLKLSVKPPIITHPDHNPVHKFNTIEELFGSYRNIIEDPAPEIDSNEFNKYLDEQTNLIKKIDDAVNKKHLLYIDYEENPFRSVPNGVREPTMIKKNPNYHISNYKQLEEPFRMKNELTHYDHLLAQGMKSSKLIHDLRTSKLQKCKRIAQMIEIHFKRLSQEKEKQEKDHKKKIMRLARETAKEVKKKWLIAVKAYKILEEKEKERERLAKSKEQLSKILDHSTKVLGAQMIGRSSSNNNSSIEPENFDADVDNDDTLSSSSDESTYEKHISTDKNIAKERDSNDNELSVEELKEKYKMLNNVNDKSNSNGKVSSLINLYAEEDNQVNHGIIDRLTDAEREKLLKENSINPLLSEDDDESESLSDDTDISSSDDELESDSDGRFEKSGLQSLFNSTTGSDNDDDESVYSETHDIETPSSSPEHVSDALPIDDDNGIPNVPTPILLKGTLRPYQKQGLNWLASLYNNGTNGILADEMGLGKTIQTISLLSYLACEKNIWGPHLIVVPTSVMLNWEMEFKRFAPGFKVLTYYGSPQQRKEKRKGWNTPDTFHVCITSYQLVVHDQPIFRRKKWKYMILDEAHNIKNFRSQRWKALLNFNTEHRILLTGTPLQNNIIELWSLLYFLMPSSKEGNVTMPEGFADLMDFQQWFGKPVDKIIQQGGNDHEAKETVTKLHQVLRPYLLRRLKQDVEKQMPAKYEHIVYCRLSKRQRLLYDDFMSRAQTKETLASGNFLSIINCLMQLRKVCNHPDLFEVRPILTSFAQEKTVSSNFELKNDLIKRYFKSNGTDIVDMRFINLDFSLKYSANSTSYHLRTIQQLNASKVFDEKILELESKLKDKQISPNFDDLMVYYQYILDKENKDLLDLMKHRKYVNDFNCNKHQPISSSLIGMLTIKKSRNHWNQLFNMELVKSVSGRSALMKDIIEKYAFVTPKVVCNNMNDLLFPSEFKNEFIHASQYDVIQNPFHQIQVKTSIAFPDKSLLQYDCGKLQKLAQLLHTLIPQEHRVLIFTQMSKVLDILELFLNYHGYTYMRLDGATKIEDRQLLTERFNNDSRVKCFILSTRAGGLGINLTGADTVIFYDSDWNPAIDKQCQDRCHRIGQTRDVHIYRFVSEYTIEANILKKAEQKKHLDNVIIQEGDFTTDYFNKVTVQELMGNAADALTKNANETPLASGREFTKALEMAEDDEDAKAAEIAMKESNVDVEDFSDDEKNSTANKSDIESLVSSKKSMNSDTAVNLEEDEMAINIVNQKEIRENHLTKERKEENVDGMEIDETGNVIYEEEDDEDDIGHVDEYMIRFIAGGYYFD
jgi:helicase SWR1